MDIQGLIAAFINGFGVLLVVQILKFILPILKTKLPWLIPIIAAAAGPVVAALQNWLSTVLGVPIDLSEIPTVFTLFIGSSAVAIYQVKHQITKMRGIKK